MVVLRMQAIQPPSAGHAWGEAARVMPEWSSLRRWVPCGTLHGASGSSGSARVPDRQASAQVLMSRTRLLMFAATVLGSGLLDAEDIDVNDLRLKAGFLSDAYKQADATVVSTSPTYTTSIAKNADSNGRVELEWCHIAFGDGGGLVLGVDARAESRPLHRQRSSHHALEPGRRWRGRVCPAPDDMRSMSRRRSSAALGAAARRDWASTPSGMARLITNMAVASRATAPIAGSYQLGIEVPYRITRSKPTSELYRLGWQLRDRDRITAEHRRIRLPARPRDALLENAAGTDHPFRPDSGL
jgi:hypothetical protein